MKSEDFPWLASAIVSHHRDAPYILNERYDPRLSPQDRDLLGMVAELDDDAILGVARWLDEMAPRWLGSTRLTRLGVEATAAVPLEVDVAEFRRRAPTAIDEALRAYREVWEAQRGARGGSQLARAAILLRGLVVLSDHMASGRARPMDKLVLPQAADLLAQATRGAEPRSHQVAAASSIGSIVLAAPTGSGKTEAALLWARKQLEDPTLARKLVYLLPYQASLNAMRRRLESSLGVEVGLLHGRAAQVVYRDLIDKGYGGQQAERAARRATDLARLHHPPVWVATPYQLLRAAYRLPGYETIWTSLGKTLVVIDEPHAYDPPRLGLILGLLHELVERWGTRVCAMTATMPNWLRKLLEDALGAASVPVDRALFAQFRRHQVRMVDGELSDEQTVRRIATEVRDGRSVLVVANTVRGDQTARDALAGVLGEHAVRLLHSRFTGEDRLAKEAEIMRLLRAGEPGMSEPIVVVSTQVIEVSLDLDFDTIYSEPAPLEALAQRFGRVNRRGAKGIAPVNVLSGPADGQHIYDPRLVQRTLARLRSVDGWVLDEALLSDYLDTIYAEDLAAEFAGRVMQFRRDFEADCTRGLSAFESNEELADRFDDLFDGTEVLPLQLLDEYRKRQETSVLDAQSLLVPLSDSQRRMARHRAVWQSDLRVWTIDYPYDSVRGLQIRDTTEVPTA